MYFPSKKDVRYVLIHWFPILLLVVSFRVGLMSFGIEDIFNLDVLGYFLLVLIVGEFNLQLLIWFRTGCTIEAGFLLIRSGPFKRKINLSDIKKLRPTKVPFPAMIPFTSPAFSSERIEVVYGKRDE